MSIAARDASPVYVERLSVPVLWWVLAVLLALTCGGAVLFYLGPVWGIAVGVVTMAIAAAVFAGAAVTISCDQERLRVGRAMIEVRYLGDCRALSAEETTRRAGPEADARAFLVLRPYLDTAVELTLVDPIDPVPYWLISTRYPQRFAQAVRTALSRAGSLG